MTKQLKLVTFLSDDRTKILSLIFLGSLLIFIPMGLVLKTFTESAADHLVRNWLQSEYVSLQQGQVLSSVLKLERSIKESSLIESVLVVNETERPLIEMGKPFAPSKTLTTTKELNVQSGSWRSFESFGKRIYHLKINQLTLYIVTGTPILFYLALGMIFYMLLTLTIFYQVLKRQWMKVEKAKSEHIVKELKLKNDFEQKISRFGRQFAHDIRSPLSALKMIHEDLEKEMSKNALPAQLKENISLVPDIIARLENISAKVLSSKMTETTEENQSQFKSNRENVVEITERVIAEKTIELSSKANVSFHLKKHSEQILAEIDRIEFMRALSNLINNAFEASVGQEKILIEIDLYKDEKETFTLAIKDHGKGLSPENIEHLKHHNATIDKPGGHGLGLTHLKEFLKHHAGSFDLSSQLGKGALLTLKIPRLSDSFVHIVHIDDESVIRLLWKKKAREQNLSLLSLSHPDEVFQFLDHIDPKKTHIYSDFFFEGSQNSGLETLVKLKELGHENLYLSSGINFENEINKDYYFPNIGKVFPQFN